MTDDYRDESVTLMMGDCIERMTEIGDGSVDLIACDLPYGTTSCRWDSVIPFDPMWAQFKRVLKDRGAVVLTASQPFTSALVLSNPKWFRHELVWDKQRGTGFLDVHRKPMKSHESILVFAATRTTYNPQMRAGLPYTRKAGKCGASVTADLDVSAGGVMTRSKGGRYPLSIVSFPKLTGDHETAKPVALMEYLIRTYSNEDETVLDCTMGSGTTGVACVNTGRSFIGIERDPGYFATATARIQSAQTAARQLLPLTSG